MKAKYIIGQRVYRIYYAWDALYRVPGYKIYIKKVIVKQLEYRTLVFYIIHNNSGLINENNLFSTEKEAEDECMKRNIILELEK